MLLISSTERKTINTLIETELARFSVNDYRGPAKAGKLICIAVSFFVE